MMHSVNTVWSLMSRPSSDVCGVFFVLMYVCVYMATFWELLDLCVLDRILYYPTTNYGLSSSIPRFTLDSYRRVQNVFCWTTHTAHSLDQVQGNTSFLPIPCLARLSIHNHYMVDKTLKLNFEYNEFFLNSIQDNKTVNRKYIWK